MLNGVNVTRVSGFGDVCSVNVKSTALLFLFFVFLRVGIQAHEEDRGYQAGPERESRRCVGSEEDGDQ